MSTKRTNTPACAPIFCIFWCVAPTRWRHLTR